MKRALPVMGIALIAGTMLARAKFAATEPLRTTASTSAAAARSLEPRVEPQVTHPPAVPSGRTTTSTAPRAASTVSPVAFGSWELLGVLDRALRLSEIQRMRAEEILRERNRQVDEYGAEVARRGWAQAKDFERRVGAIREEAVRRLAAILDSAQAEQLAWLASAGRLDDHLAIEIPDGLVVLD